MLLLLHQAKLKTEEEEIQSHVFPSNSQKVMTHPEQLNKSFFDVKGYMTIYSLQHVCFYVVQHEFTVKHLNTRLTLESFKTNINVTNDV